jgi:predicted membrane channel-forming protein YqfA (hemolysin III family)
MKLKIVSVNELPPGWLAYPYTDGEYRVNYSWKMALKSIIYTGHNEFWMIWTEIIPFFVFLWMYMKLLQTDTYSDMDSFKQLLCNIMYSAAICCRGCSFVYHTFNCTSLQMNTALMNLDLIGIATNALGVPWIAYLYFEKHTVENLYMKYVICSYFLVFFRMYIETNLFHIRCFLNVKYFADYSNNNLFYLAVVGNIPTNMVVLYASSLSDYGRMCLICGQLFLLFGFVLFYNLKLPECIFGYNKVMNSHVMWHMFTFAGQYCYLMTAFH